MPPSSAESRLAQGDSRLLGDRMGVGHLIEESAGWASLAAGALGGDPSQQWRERGRGGRGLEFRERGKQQKKAGYHCATMYICAEIKSCERFVCNLKSQG